MCVMGLREERAVLWVCRSHREREVREQEREFRVADVRC